MFTGVEVWQPARRLLVLVIVVLLAGCSSFLGTEPQRYILYPVVQGDSMASIAHRFEVSLDQIEQANKLTSRSALKPGQVLKIPYHGQSLTKTERDAKNLKASLAPNPASVNLLKLSKARVYVGKLIWPVKNGLLTSRFGRRWLSFHEGIDIYAAIGTTVRAAHDGQVVYSGDGLRGYGNLIVVKSPELLTIYAHNRRNLVRAGQEVDQGQPIAELGQSGKATGPHLHFETRIKNDKGLNAAVDPLVFFQRPSH